MVAIGHSFCCLRFAGSIIFYIQMCTLVLRRARFFKLRMFYWRNILLSSKYQDEQGAQNS